MTGDRPNQLMTGEPVAVELDESIWDRPVLPIPRIAPLAPSRRHTANHQDAVKALSDRVRRLHTLVLWTLAALILSGIAIAVGVGPQTQTEPAVQKPVPLHVADAAERCEQAVKDAAGGNSDAVTERRRVCAAAAAAALAAAEGVIVDADGNATDPTTP